MICQMYHLMTGKSDMPVIARYVLDYSHMLFLAGIILVSYCMY